MKKYGLHGSLRATDGNGEALSQILIEAARVVSELKGCKLYVVSRQHDDGDIIWVTEIWDSAEDHRNALRDARVLALISQAMPMLDASSNHRQELEVVGGYGI